MSKQDPAALQQLPPTSAHNWAVIERSQQLEAVGAGAAIPALDGEQEALPPNTAAESMVEVLCGLGLTTFFGVPGGPVIPVFDAILTQKKARLIEPRHETGGAFAAMGYHRASGKVPVVVVTAGPGSTNVVTGVVSAHLERVPMLVICGDVPWSSTGHKMLQDTGIAGVGIERMLQGVTRCVVRIAHAASCSSQVRAAVEAATSPHNPGPALVVISIDRAGSRAAPPRLYTPPLLRATLPAAPEPALLKFVASSLRAAEHPLVLLGAGCRGQSQKMQALVEALGIPFATTPQAKGLLPEDHRLSLRNCGMGASLWARRYMKAGPDVTLVLGTDLDDVSIVSTPPVRPGGVLIHVDTDPAIFARNVPTMTGAMYDAGLFAEGLTQVARRWDAPRDGMALAAEARAVPPFDVPDFAEDDSVPLMPHRAVADLSRAAGPNTTFVSDIGEHMIFALHYLTIHKDQRFVIHLGLGSMGSGICSSVGQAIGDPTRRVICICGDGGTQMSGAEILVAVKLRLPIVYAIFNDARYNMVFHGYRLTYGRDEAWNTPPVDFVKWAESMGAVGHLVERPGQITRDLLERLTASGGPVVLDIRYNSDVRVRGSGRVEAVKDMAATRP